MTANRRSRRFLTISIAGSLMLLAVLACATIATRSAHAGWLWGAKHHCQNCCDGQGYVGPGNIIDMDSGGTWYWMRSPEQERRVVMTLFNRYCIRCHGVDGRGVWDIPDVPDFTNTIWQATRPDPYRCRVILEGRGAVMPAFRGTLTLEEACAMARYLHTFVPGTEVSRPDLGAAAGPSTAGGMPGTVTPAAAPVPTAPAPPPPAAAMPPASTTSGPFSR
jgi:hypothetical protein